MNTGGSNPVTQSFEQDPHSAQEKNASAMSASSASPRFNIETISPRARGVNSSRPVAMPVGQM